jgi:diguanylate cyclase (GGDEF)-like protein
MRNPALPLSEPDPALLHKLALIEQGYLAVVSLISVAALCGWLVPDLGHWLPGSWSPVRPQIAVAALLSAGGLELSRSRHPAWMKQTGFAFALLLAMLAVAVLSKDVFGVSVGLDRFAAASPDLDWAGRMPPMAAIAFVALADGIMLIRAHKGLASHLADLFVAVFCLLTLIMISAYIMSGMAGPAASEGTSLLTLLGMSLLAFVAFMRRAETGAFAAFVGAGSGSRIARIVAPLVLLVPFLPQTALSHAVKSGHLHTEYLSLVAAYTTAAVSLAAMIYMAWKINRLERRLRDLSLQDEKTGLYGRRGFFAVGWQALRQARRSGLPFSVMFIDVENVGRIRETLSEQAAGELLQETAELLKASFRASDVIGRIDPAQFAVAGHFSQKTMGVMRLRLYEAVNYRNSNPGRSYSLAFSIGCVSARDPRTESLEDLIAQAEEARDQAALEKDALAPTSTKETMTPKETM